DDTSSSGDHTVMSEFEGNGANDISYVRKDAGASDWGLQNWLFEAPSQPYPLFRWKLSSRLTNGQWYRIEYKVHFTDSTHIQPSIRIYNASGTLLYTDADIQQEDYGSATPPSPYN